MPTGALVIATQRLSKLLNATLKDSPWVGLLALLAILVLGYLLVVFLKFRSNLTQAAPLIAQARRYEQQSVTSGPKVLVVGDSTAVGVGASVAVDSVAGRFGADYPRAAITNLSVSGARIADVLQQLQSAPDNYDIIIIHAGANDVFHFVDLQRSRPQLDELLKLASTKSKRVYHYTSGKLGEAPAIPWLLKSIYNRRALTMRRMAQQLADQHGATYVDLLKDGRDLFSQEPKLYYAADNFHPSSAGYELWYGQLRPELNGLDESRPVPVRK